jgi:hypothetical protein
MTQVKSFGILVEAKGEGVSGLGDLVIGSSGDRKSKISSPTTAEGGGATWEWSGANPRQSGMSWDDRGGEG